MGGKGVEPLRTFVHTVLSRARLPFRHPPITEYILENCAAFCKTFFFSVIKRRRADIIFKQNFLDLYADGALTRALAAYIVHNTVVAVFFFQMHVDNVVRSRSHV